MPDDLTFHSHPSDDLLEIYALGKLTDEELAEVEEHLILCRRCQKAVEDFDSFIRATKNAAGDPPEEKPQSRWGRVFEMPKVFLAAATLVLMAGLITVTYKSTNQPPQFVQLTAVRGGEATANVAAANVPVQLSLDLTDLPPAPGYTVELVDQRGITKWDQHDVPPAGTKLTVDLTRPLIPGQYWVRLYPNALKNELLREFSLLVK